MTGDTIQIVCFSHNRPLQLHGYLRSFYDFWAEPNVAMRVLMRADSSDFTHAYAELQREFSNVEWCTENNFPVDVASLIHSSAEYTLFGCDDVVFVRPISTTDIKAAFSLIPDLLALSFRLGSTVRQGMFSQMAQPPFLGSSGRWLYWHTDQGVEDWAYPWDVLGSVYRTSFVRLMLDNLTDARNPFQFEERGALRWPALTPLRGMASWQSPRIVVPTVNVVTEGTSNGIKGNVSLSPEFLLTCWQAGLRLDTRAIAQLSTDAWRVPDFHLRRLI